LVTPLISLKEIGEHLAETYGVDAGDYDLVIEYKLASTVLTEKGENYPAMGIAVSGFSLRPAKKIGPFTITVSPKRGKKRSKVVITKPA